LREIREKDKSKYEHVAIRGERKGEKNLQQEGRLKMYRSRLCSRGERWRLQFSHDNGEAPEGIQGGTVLSSPSMGAIWGERQIRQLQKQWVGAN